MSIKSFGASKEMLLSRMLIKLSRAISDKSERSQWFVKFIKCMAASK